MGIKLIVVGKCKAEEQALVHRYQKRLQHTKLTVYVLDDRKTLQQQGKAIQEAVGNSPLWIFDSTGLNHTTQEFANRLQSQLSTHKDIALAIGGSYGFSAEIQEQAAEKIALGQMTFPHQLVQVLVLEQLYRCQCLAANHPYHH